MTDRPRDASVPLMVLGACALVAAMATGLYLGINPKAVAPEQAVEPAPAVVPKDEWLATAAQKRHSRDYSGAREAYLQVIRQNAMTADAWADYADTLASLSGGSLAGEAAQALQRALDLDPAHPKALWLEATRAYQERRYAQAVELWKRLRAVLGPESPDVAIIDANIAESEQLARAPAG